MQLEIGHDLHILEDEVLVAIGELELLEAVAGHVAKLGVVVDSAEEHGVVGGLSSESSDQRKLEMPRRKSRKAHLAQIGQNMSTRRRIGLVTRLGRSGPPLLLDRLGLLLPLYHIQDLLLLPKLLNRILIRLHQRLLTPHDRLAIHLPLQRRHLAPFHPLELLR